MRLIIAAVLIAATAVPVAAETKKQRAVRCAAQAGIVGQAVELRQKKKSEAKAKELILTETEAVYAPTVAPLVGYVFTLNREDLKLDVSGAFEEQCNAFQP